MYRRLTATAAEWCWVCASPQDFDGAAKAFIGNICPWEGLWELAVVCRCSGHCGK